MSWRNNIVKVDKEVICISKKPFYSQDGTPMNPAPKYEEKYHVYAQITAGGELYYFIVGFGDNKGWFSKDFADISNLQEEISDSLKRPVMEIYIRKAQEELQSSQHRRPDYLFDPLKYGNWLHIIEEFSHETPH